VAWCRDRQSPGLAFVLQQLGALVSVQGDPTRGTALLREALTLQQQLGREDLTVDGLDGFAWLVARGSQRGQRACWEPVNRWSCVGLQPGTWRTNIW
jgi:hypothetical protein